MSFKIKIVLSVAYLLIIYGAGLFIPAGTLSWFAGWSYLICFLAFCFGLIAWLARHSPGLLEERMSRSKPNQKTWDKVYIRLISALFMIWLVLMPLDTVRCGWSHMPLWLRLFGVVITGISCALFFLVYRENPYLSGMVRIQKERGHAVVSTGPYAFVRHPMYSAAILYFIGTAFWLDSWVGFWIGWLLTLVMGIRAVLEEKVLKAELPGYDDYMLRVRYRLIPFLW